MQHTSEDYTPQKQGRGGRISSPRLRETIDQSRDFAGLEEGVKPHDLLRLVKRAGKAAGFTPKMIQLLDHYMMFTREIDWEQGCQPVVYQSLYRTAMDLGVSERQIQKLEKQLFNIGALSWKDSGNCKRYGQRCADTGRILYAYGVDLTPLAYLKPKLEEIIQEQELYKAAWMETKRQMSWYRGQIKAILAEAQEQGRALPEFSTAYDDIARPYRTSTPLKSMREGLSEHKALYESLLEAVTDKEKEQKHQNSSCRDDSLDAHKQTTNQSFKFNKLNTSRDKSHSFQGSRNSAMGRKRAEPEGLERPEDDKALILKTGLQHVTVKQLLNAASPRFKDQIPMKDTAMSMDDVVEAAYKLRPALHISQKSWGRACETLTRYGAAICVLLVDQAVQREENPVQKPAAYFNTLIARARAGELYIHKSIFGLLKRETGEPANNSAETSSHERS